MKRENLQRAKEIDDELYELESGRNILIDRDKPIKIEIQYNKKYMNEIHANNGCLDSWNSFLAKEFIDLYRNWIDRRIHDLKKELESL